MMTQDLVTVKNVSYGYPTQGMQRALSFTVRRGECMALIGANGSGKTTTLNLLAGLLRPQRGEVLIQGINIHTHPRRAKLHLGFLPDFLPLYLDLTVMEYLSFIAKLRQIPKLKRKDAIAETIEQLNLAPYRQYLIGRLSKGLKQRVGLAQAILHRPSVLLLDEPTQGLDTIHIEIFQELLKNYKKNAAIILSTHYLNEVEGILDHALQFNSEGITSYDLHHCTT